MNRHEANRWMKSLQHDAPAPTAYGVYLWRGDGNYQRDAPAAVYKTERGAQHRADRLNETTTDPHGYVVRPIYGDTQP